MLNEEETSGRSRSQKFDAAFYTLPFDNGVYGVGGNVLQSFDAPVWPANFHFTHHRIARQSEVQARITGGNVAGTGFHFFNLGARCGSNGDPGAHCSTITLHSD